MNRPGEDEMILLRTNDVNYFTQKYIKVNVQQKSKRRYYSADYCFVIERMPNESSSSDSGNQYRNLRFPNQSLSSSGKEIPLPTLI